MPLFERRLADERGRGVEELAGTALVALSGSGPSARILRVVGRLFVLSVDITLARGAVGCFNLAVCGEANRWDAALSTPASLMVPDARRSRSVVLVLAVVDALRVASMPFVGARVALLLVLPDTRARGDETALTRGASTLRLTEGEGETKAELTRGRTAGLAEETMLALDSLGEEVFEVAEGLGNAAVVEVDCRAALRFNTEARRDAGP